MPLLAVADETVIGAAFGTAVTALTGLVVMFSGVFRKGSAQATAQWRAYGESMAKKYQDEVIRNAATDAELHAKLLEKAEQIGRLTAENAALKERLK